MAENNNDQKSSQMNSKEEEAKKKLSQQSEDNADWLMKHGNVTIEIKINDKGEASAHKDIKESTASTQEQTKADTNNDSMKEKEIDLLEVSGHIAKSLKNGTKSILSFIGKSIRIAFALLFRAIKLGLNSWLYLSLIIVIAAGISMYLYHNNKGYYNTEGYARTQLATSEELILIINSISIPNDSSNIRLNNDLNLPPEVYNNIKSLKASWLIDEDGDGLADLVDYNDDYFLKHEKDTLARRLEDRFNIRLQVWDLSITDEVQDALLAYVKNHPYIKMLNDSRIDQLSEMLNVYHNQAVVLDSLQYYEFFIEEQQQNLLSGLKFGEFEITGAPEQKDKRLYYEDIIKLKENAIKSSSSLTYESDPLVFVGNMSKSTERVNSFSFYLKKVSAIWIPLALLIFIIIKRKELEQLFDIKKLTEEF